MNTLEVRFDGHYIFCRQSGKLSGTSMIHKIVASASVLGADWILENQCNCKISILSEFPLFQLILQTCKISSVYCQNL